MVVGLVDSLWERRIQSIFAKAEDAAERDPGPNDVVMLMGGVRLMTGNWTSAVPNVTAHLLRELPPKLSQWMMMRSDDPVPPRALAVNLSARLRQFHAALAESHMGELASTPVQRDKTNRRRARRTKG